METGNTVIATHHTRWDLSSYRHGWTETDRIITADYGAIDEPTARILAGDAIERANAIGREDPTYYHLLGSAARWLAALT